MINSISNVTTLKITITALKPDHRGQPYSVAFDGKTIVARSHVPSYDACRYLIGLGLTGPLEVWSGNEPSPRLRICDIIKAAKWTVSESAARSARVVRYVPFSESQMYRELEDAA